MLSKRWRSATSVGTISRDWSQAVKRATSSSTIASALASSVERARQVLADDRLQVVDVVEEHLVQIADRRLDVARQRDVDDEQRSICAAAASPPRRRPS